MKRFMGILLATALCIPLVHGTVFTVDKVNGPLTTIRAGCWDTEPGDTVLIRGGVYNESVGLRNNGTSDAYITVKNYPGEEVIVDGSMVLEGWTRCASAAEAGGNPDFANIWYADPGRSVKSSYANLYEGEMSLVMGMDPALSDPFFDKQTGNFRIIPTNGLTQTTLTDADYFTQSDPEYWVGSDIKILTGNNFTYICKITAYSPSEHMVTFTGLADVGVEYGKDSYALSNHVTLVRKPGQYYVDEANDIVYLWPIRESSLAAGQVTLTTRSNGFVISGRQYVRVEGIIIRRMYDNAIIGEGCTGVILKDLQVCQNMAKDHEWAIKMTDGTDNLIEGCRVYNNRHSRGILNMGGTNNIVRNCLLDKNGSTGINFYGEDGSLMEGNVVLNHRGKHANGVTCYSGCKDITLRGNYVRDGGNAHTFQEINGLTCINNVFVSSSWAVANWGGTKSYNLTFLNNTIYTTNSSDYALRMFDVVTNLTFKNNICKGWPGKSGDCANNLYVRVTSHNPAVGGTESLVDETGVFLDAANGDFRIGSASPAKDMGTDVGVSTDITGAARTSPDAGAYEYWSGETTVPTVTSVTAVAQDKVEVVFSEVMDGRFTLAHTNYAIDNDISVGRTAMSVDGMTVTLTVSPMENKAYTLSVSHARDLAQNTITPDSETGFSFSGSGIGHDMQDDVEYTATGMFPAGTCFSMNGALLGQTAPRTGIYLMMDEAGRLVKQVTFE